MAADSEMRNLWPAGKDSSRPTAAPAADLQRSDRISVVADDVRLRYTTTKVSRPGTSRGLRVRLGARRQRVSVLALRGVSFSVTEGEFVGIIGRNGSGKSSLLRVLAGLEAPTSGSVLTSARPMLLGVSAALIPHLTGAQNIRLGCLAMGMTPEQADEAFNSVVELSALGDAIDLPMQTYSSGMGARLRFAISLAASPEILMIDEALATGDAVFMDRSKRAMKQMLERAGTVFLVNHAAQAIEEMCTRAIWMDHGRMVMDGEAVTVARKYRWFAHNLAQGDTAKAASLLQAAMEEGESTRAPAPPERIKLPQNVPARRQSIRGRHRRFGEAPVIETQALDPYGQHHRAHGGEAP
ncbi:ABC transporter ATP-binding protein [Devriesea agamarum]|uniref:ABC transporter ATP-binding protein n=1 Tax=Devriesea agamarum TaxID=472569 RepID=UPI00071C7C5F|nr:ABC transporter ATP-binding protein [Devriesea agamarum]